MNFIINLKDLDSRFIYLLLAFAVGLPLIVGMDFPVFPGSAVKGIYNYIEELPEGSRVFLSFDYDPGSEPELGPSAAAMILHLFRRNHIPICGGNWPLGGEMADAALETAINAYEATYDELYAKGEIAQGAPESLEYGTHYVNLGFRPGALIHVRAMTSDFMGTYSRDREGRTTRTMDIFQTDDGEEFTIKDIDMIISFTAGTGGIEEFIHVSGEHGRPMAAGCTSVNIPRFITYVQTGQLVGIAGGLPGAAEYETLVGYMGTGRGGMASQSFGHLIIMIFIVLGNIGYIVESRRNSRK